MKNSIKTFLLIHGAWEGAWSWEQTTENLEKKGHKVIAIDLPGHGNDNTDVSKITLAVYTNRVKKELVNIGKPVILVGHSFAGFIISQVAEEMPDSIEKLIYVASALPYDGKTAVEVFEEDEESEFLENLVFSDDKSTATMSRETILKVIFTGATEEQIDQVLPKLVEQATKPFFEKVILSDSNFGRVQKAYVETTQDKVISLKAQRLGQERLGINESVTLERGHVPLETAPQELANALGSLANSIKRI
ncbi:alpha/beta fold hydrolase [Flagellimonas meridianipacifica]|uniref:Pimeloyl-ACP methyl ester carboxylesterase n=1 Tax=Flagellimonas meridianipacifica TaxID=1080225 RepID=A0A2T0MI18_9FLAO|nr:alpha/beta hydrolase [Allomuricauda pacifica]PRX57212.1 pimeloyl-ACP methyl ester carboxylesterase [Allomuricauda pacifica]